MIDLKLLSEDPEKVKKNLSKRGFDLTIIDKLVAQDSRRRECIHFVETHRAEIKRLSREVGKLKQAGQDASEFMQKVGDLKAQMASREEELNNIKKELELALACVPNLVHEDVPEGKNEEDNVELKKWGNPKKFSFQPKDHHELGENLGLLDFETASKIVGARFAVYRGASAKLERALISFMLDQHTANGYEEVMPPYIVNEKAMFGTGQLPKFAEDAFKIHNKDWYLISTAEIPLTNLVREQILRSEELPIKVCAYTPCFRSEAGSYGKDTRGLIRQHQFNKVELVNIVKPEDSLKAHEDMVERACSILELLELPYRAMLLCGGDIGFGAHKCVDLEVWLPGQARYREISSVSTCHDFQARRASIRYRNEEGKPQFAHTLNGSGLAVGRTLLAIMENYQREDGSIEIPKIVIPYMGGLKVISK